MKNIIISFDKNMVKKVPVSELIPNKKNKGLKYI